MSTAFEYDGHPHSWVDKRTVECQFGGGNGACKTRFELFSNEHLQAEIDRLEAMNGVFERPACKCCGKKYLAAPEEFLLDGAEMSKPKSKGTVTPDRVRLIHKPCRGKPGVRISATLDHKRQRQTADNVAILLALVNGAGISKLRRMTAPANWQACGAKRVYDRIFWLERTLLAFEKAQLARWKAEVEASGDDPKHHLAHDDLIMSVNWETSEDRRITQLNCAATADVRSGYVFRIDADFDPTADPVSVVQDAYRAEDGSPKNVRQSYERKSRLTFTAPKMSFQRPTERFDEHHLFAAARHQLRLFRQEAHERMPETNPMEADMKADILSDVADRLAFLEQLSAGYFNIPDAARASRFSFSGCMTRDIYTKAAHFAALRNQLPTGSYRLITEQEGTLPGILPHIFRQEIEADRFVWLATTFAKNVKKPVMQARVAGFRTAFQTFLDDLRAHDPAAEAEMTNGQRLRAFIAQEMRTATNVDRFGAVSPVQSDNYRQRFMPQVWVRSPIQTAGEIDKLVGFPLLRRQRRAALKPLAFDQEITDPDTRAAVAYHVWSATLQPVSTFFNAARERLSFARRAGGRSARAGSESYVSGAVFNPRVLIAVLNIFRVYYNWFEPRQYTAPWLEDGGAQKVASGHTMRRIRGTNQMVPMKKRAVSKPILRTPAMRLGLQPVRHDRNGRLITPSLHRVLYRPWIFYGTPVWDKFENPKADKRRAKSKTRNVKSQSIAAE